MLGIFVCRYACTADIADLERAHRLAELVASFSAGRTAGSIKGIRIILPSSTLQNPSWELVRAQLARAEDARIPPEDRALWRGRAERHMAALVPRHGAPLPGWTGIFKRRALPRPATNRANSLLGRTAERIRADALRKTAPTGSAIPRPPAGFWKARLPTSRRLSRIAGWRAARCALGGAIRCGDGRHAFGAPCPNDEFAPRLVGLEYLWPVPPVAGAHGRSAISGARHERHGRLRTADGA